MRGSFDADVLILGGGCAGLSLAAHLAQPGAPALRTLVLEPRETYENDRTWSGWRGRPHLFSACVSASWDNWRVAAGGRDVISGSARHRYETIPAGAFYAEARRHIANAGRVTLRQACTARRTGADANGAWADTSQGRLRAALVVDTRPPRPMAGAGLLQTFTGLEIETTQPCFDAGVADLMLFQPPSAEHVSFLYSLPYGPTRALFELTRFAAGDLPPPTDAEVLASLPAHLHGRFSVRRFESGTLAMRPGLPPPLRHPRLLTLGTLAGAARPATGYAFAAIQHQAEALAQVLRLGPDAAQGWRPAPLPAWMRFMDRLFLRVLRQHPARGPALFHSLFAHCDAPALVRFLSGDASLLDAARVAAALPKAPFLSALVQPPARRTLAPLPHGATA